MIGFNIKVDLSALDGLAQDLELLARDPVRLAVRRWSKVLSVKIQTELKRKTLGRQYYTRELLNSVRVEEGTFSDTRMELNVVSDVPYAMIYEEEDASARTIRPKRAKYLTVPTPAAYQGGFTRKATPLRSFSNTFLRPTTGGRAAFTVFLKPGAKQKPIPIYWLVREVTLPYRPWLSNAMELGLPTFQKILADTVSARMARAS